MPEAGRKTNMKRYARNRAFSLQMPNGHLFNPCELNETSVSKHSSLEALDEQQVAKPNGVVLLTLGAELKKTPRKLSMVSESVRSWGKEAASPLGSMANAIADTRTRLRRQSTVKKMKRSRLVHKNGDCNVSHLNVPRKERQYIKDIFTTLIDVPWHFILLLFASGFVASWTFFAIVYFVICSVHGDFDHFNETKWEPCVYNVYDFVSVFLFSVETQHTIGYGKRFLTTTCGSAIFTLSVQSICGLLIQSFMAGLVFAKLARPKKRAETLIFSKEACVTLRDGQLCFLIRVGDMRNTHLVQAHLRLQMIKKRVTEEGELLPLQQYDMDVGFGQGLDRIFLVWPITICHMIDKTSPLYDYAGTDLSTAQFEIIVILEGIVESTGMTAQARTSYLPSEIFWGHRFEKLVTYQKQNGEYQIDYKKFHSTYPVNTPKCSAKELDLMTLAGGGSLGSQYYESHDDGLDSEGVSPSSSRNPSFDGTTDNGKLSGGKKLNDEQKKFLLSPMSAKSKNKSPTSPTTFMTHPPEIVVVSPSNPSLNTSVPPSRRNSFSNQHEIL